MELQLIHSKVFTIRGMRVMIDFHLAELYDVETSALNQAVKRNQKRFPIDFMFQLTKKEWRSLKAEMINSRTEPIVVNFGSQIAEANPLKDSQIDDMWSQIVTTSKRRKDSLPYAFTEQGVANAFQRLEI